MSDRTNKSGSVLDQLTAQHSRRSLTDHLTQEAEQRRASDVATEMTTSEVCIVQLHRRIQRLAQLATLQAPPVYLATEIYLLLDAVQGAYPEEVASVQTQRMKIRTKERLGRCVHDTCEQPVAPGLANLGYCAEHFKQVETELS